MNVPMTNAAAVERLRGLRAYAEALAAREVPGTVLHQSHLDDSEALRVAIAALDPRAPSRSGVQVTHGPGGNFFSVGPG